MTEVVVKILSDYEPENTILIKRLFDESFTYIIKALAPKFPKNDTIFGFRKSAREKKTGDKVMGYMKIPGTNKKVKIVKKMDD